MEISTVNPATGKRISTYKLYSDEKIDKILMAATVGFDSWKKTTIDKRCELLKNLVKLLKEDRVKLAQMMTDEMGKVEKEALAEVDKCAWLSEVYIENLKEWLADEVVVADGLQHRVVFQPLGVIVSIMPWNFPFWQALRFGIPTILAGNVSILKHSNQVPGCALLIEDLFKRAGFPEGVFQAVLATHQQVTEKLIRAEKVRGISLTGSTEAGQKVASEAGKYLKKVVLELGGSDPFIVLEDADIEAAAKGAAAGRLLNCGQSCIAAKRFIVIESIADRFTDAFIRELSKIEVGPLVNIAAVNELKVQLEDARKRGGDISIIEKKTNDGGFYFNPAVVRNASKEMSVVTQEVFGPIAPIIRVKNEREAIEIANSTEFGLGGSVWTKDLARGERVALELECGSVFVNSMVKSDPRMPFGGVKMSGIGRELSKWGLREFVNVKGLNIYS